MPKRFRITVSRVRFHWIKSSLTMTTVSLHLFPPLMLQLHARYYIVSMISKSGILPCTEIFFYRNNNQSSREIIYSISCRRYLPCIRVFFEFWIFPPLFFLIKNFSTIVEKRIRDNTRGKK